MALEYIPGETFMHKLDPRSKLVFFLCISLIVTGINDPGTLIAIYAAILMLARSAHIPMKKITSLIKPVTPAIALYFIIGYFYSSATMELCVPVSFSLFGLLVSFDFSVIRFLIAFTNCTRFVTFITLVRVITLVTPIHLLLRSLVKWKLPPEIARAFSSAFASVPIFVNKIRSIMDAQISRGLRGLETRNPLGRGKAMFPVIVPTIMAATRRSSILAAAIESRGFGRGARGLTFRTKVRLAKRDYAFLGAMIASSIVLIYFGSHGVNRLDYLASYRFLSGFLATHQFNLSISQVSCL